MSFHGWYDITGGKQMKVVKSATWVTESEEAALLPRSGAGKAVGCSS